MTLDTWADDWSVPPEAMQDLRARFGCVDTNTPVIDGVSEAAVQSQERLRITRGGGRVFRNNVGALYDRWGTLVRFGLANDTKAMNLSMKSSDLIGVQPVMITQKHVGSIIGQFLALEVKHKGWRYTGNGREPAQLKFHELIVSLGGDARFTTGV